MVVYDWIRGLQLQKVGELFKEKGEKLPKELEFEEHERRAWEEGHMVKLFQRFLPERRKPPVIEIEVDKDPVAAERRERVKDAMRHAWTCYEKYAWGMDELKVIINKSSF